MKVNQPISELGKPEPEVSRRTVLLTGGSGVVGHALIPRLNDMNVISLTHQRTVAGPTGITSFHGDIRMPRFGLPVADYTALAHRVDAVIHCAAVTDFNRTDGSLAATNVDGTKHVLDFAATAGAPIYHISTSYLHAKADGERGHVAVGYAASKHMAEDLVRASGVPNVILRPSIVVGDSRSGEVRSFQGLYWVARTILDGVVPLLPFDPSWSIDFVPVDVVADAIATVVERKLSSGEFWITAGERALRIDEGVRLCAGLGVELGRPVDMPRFVTPEVFDRLIAPVFLQELPEKTRNTVVKLLDFFAVYLARDTAFPSSLDELVRLGARPLPDQRKTFLTVLRYWATVTGRTTAIAQGEVA